MADVTIPQLPALLTANQQQSDVYEQSNSSGSNPSAKETRAQQIYKIETDAIAAGANISITVGTLAPGNNSVTPAIISSSGQANVVTAWDGSSAPVAVTPGAHISFAGGQINSDGEPNVVTSVEGSTSPTPLSAGSGISIVGGVISNTAVVTVPDASYGEMYFNGNLAPTVVSGAGIPTKIEATYNGGQLLNFTQFNGTLTYTGSSTIGFDASLVASATMNLTSDQIQINIYHNGSVVPSSEIIYNLDGVSPSLKATPGQCIIPLNTNDTIECWVTNLTSSNSPLIGSLNCGVKSIGGSNNLADQVVVSWNGLTTPTNVTAGAGIDITGGTISATFGTTATYQTTYDATNPTATTVLAPSKPIIWQSNLTTTIPQTITYQTDISNLSNPIGVKTSRSLNSISANIDYEHSEVFMLNTTSGAESALINYDAMSVGTNKSYLTYDGLNDVVEIAAKNTNVSNQLNVGPNVSGVNFTLGTTLLFTSSYPSGVFTNVWNTLHGTNIVLANSLAIGQTIELNMTGQLASANGGTGIIQFSFGSFAIQSQIINFNGFTGQKNMCLTIKVTRVDASNVSCSVGGWFNSTTNVVTAFQMIISQAYLSYNAAINTPVILQWGPTFNPGNSFDFLAKNLNIIQYG